MALQCSKCGTINYDSDAFCAACGEKLVVNASQSPAQQTFTGAPTGTLSSRQGISLNKQTLVWLIAIAVVVVGIPLTYHYLLTETRLETTYESVPFDISLSEDEKLLKGIEYTKSPGMNGSKQVKTKVWLEDGASTNRKIVSERIVQPPVDEVVVEGNRTKSEAAEDVKSFGTDYMETWKAGDHASMISKCSQESLSGYTQDRILAAFQTTGESLESYTLGTPEVISMDDLIKEQKSSSWSYSYDEDEEEKMVPDDFPSGSLVVARIPATYTTNSSLLGRKTHYENINLAYIEGGWKMVYFGAVAAVGVNQSQHLVNNRYSDSEIVDVFLDYIVVYPDHAILGVHETNATRSRYGSSSISSNFYSISSYGYSSGDSFITDDSSASLSYTVNSDKSTKFEYSVKEGATQSGFIYVEPGFPAEANSVNVTFGSSSSSSNNARFYGVSLR